MIMIIFIFTITILLLSLYYYYYNNNSYYYFVEKSLGSIAQFGNVNQTSGTKFALILC
jgi:hypothetical protein